MLRGCLGSSGSEGSAQLSRWPECSARPRERASARQGLLPSTQASARILTSGDVLQFLFRQGVSLILSQCLYTRCVYALSVGTVCTYVITGQSPTCKALWESRALDIPLF